MIPAIDIAIGLLFLLTLGTGYGEGLVKGLSAFISTVLGFFFASKTYSILAGVLAFLPGDQWEKFIGFFAMAFLFNVLIGLFLIPARAWYENKLERSFATKIVGSIIGVINLSLGLTVLAFAVRAYPVSRLLERMISESSAFTQLVDNFAFFKVLITGFI